MWFCISVWFNISYFFLFIHCHKQYSQFLHVGSRCAILTSCQPDPSEDLHGSSGATLQPRALPIRAPRSAGVSTHSTSRSWSVGGLCVAHLIRDWGPNVKSPKIKALRWNRCSHGSTAVTTAEAPRWIREVGGSDPEGLWVLLTHMLSRSGGCWRSGVIVMGSDI